MAYDMFLKIEGIEADSTDAAHPKWIEVLSYAHGVSQAPGGTLSAEGALTGGRADHQDFSIVKRLDSASPMLFLKCCTGEHIPRVELELCRATGEKTLFMKYVFDKCIIASVTPSGSGETEDPLPMEEVTFRYSAIHLSYTVTTGGEAGAAFEAAWSTEQNQPM